MSGVCRAIIQEGPRKGDGCLFPAEEDGYCGRHKRNKEYDYILSSGRRPCRYFFRGCNSILEEAQKTCSACISKKNTDKIACKHEGCKYGAKEGGYCRKHSRDIYREQEQTTAVKYCDIARGCFNICQEGRSTCEECLESSRQKDNARYAERKALHETQTTEDKSICCYCGKEFRMWITRYNRPSKSCDTCYASQEAADKKRKGRKRNYKVERFKNVIPLFKQYVRSAEINERIFALTLEEFQVIIIKPCYYCSYYIEGEAIGVDRVDNSIGYTTSNVVPACWNCNKMKSNYNKSFFILHCSTILSGVWDLPEWRHLYIKKVKSYNAYKKSCADTRQLEWSISEETYYSIKSKPCYLCGYSESVVGIDRVDSTKGYTPENIQPCCVVCNRMKSDMTYDAFIEHVGRIVAHTGVLSE
jgi:hypothetical protein